MTKSLKNLLGRVESITSNDQFISDRQAGTLVLPVVTFAASAASFSAPQVAARIPTWTEKAQPEAEFCPIGEDHNQGKIHFVTDGTTARGGNGELVIPPGIMDEGVVLLTAPGSASGVIDFDGDTDDFTITLTAGTTYLISLRGTGATPVGDTFLQLLNAAGTVELYHDDDGGNGTYSLITYTASATGAYTIRAGTFPNPGDPDLGGYTVDVLVQGADSVGQTNATSVVLNQGTTFGFREVDGSTTGGDIDRYAVTLEAGKFYTFRLAGGSDYETGYYTAGTSSFGEMDTLLNLRNAAGTLLASGDDVSFPNDLSSGLGFFATVSGTFYLDVTAYAGSTGGYILDFQEVDLSALDPLDAIRWFSADNIDTVTVGGTPTAYVYFGAAGEDFGEGLTTLGWNAFEKAAVMQALLEFTKITGIQYAETADINQAEFRLNTVNEPSAPFGAYFYPQDPSFGTQEGIGIFNVISGGWNFVSGGIQPALQQGGFSFAVILHEFGHAHGLAHAHDNGGGSDILAGVTGAQGSLGVFNLNQGVYTVMSYNDAWWLHPDGHFGGPADPTRVGGLTTTNIDNGWSATLSAFDIAVLQERYGVHDFNVTDTVYALSDVANAANYQCIWDSGGIDTIAYGGGLQATIDLTAATLDYTATGGGVISYVIDPAVIGIPAPTSALRGGFTIANGVVIENASGGGGNDTLLGNASANVLTGNFGNDTLVGRGGDDTLNGGIGTDTARYFANRADYTIHAVITNGAITGFTITDDNTGNGDDGTDTLNGMETAQFNDVSVSLVGAVAVFDADGDLVSVHTTIQAAINAATTLDGYRIFVSRGVYAEDVNVTKDLTIQGGNVGLDGDDPSRGLESSVRSFVITANGVTLDGVEVYGQFTHPSSGGLPSGIYVAGNNFSLVNSVLDSSTATQYGILTQGVTGLDIGNNLFTNYPQGIYVSSGSSTGSIHDNLFQGDGPGSGSGLQNGVLTESTLLAIQNNTFDGIDGGSIYALPQGPGMTLDLLDIIIGNIISNSGAERPIQIYPSTLTPNVLGTDENEAFVGDWGGLGGVDLSFNGRGGNDHIYGDSGDDTFTGGSGNDLLVGGAGVDTGVFADANVTYIDTAVGWLVTSSEGNDFLQQMEIALVDGQRNLLVGSTGFAGLAAALAAAEDGDNIRLATGTYTGSFSYDDDDLTIIAQPGAQINATFTPTGTQGITIASANLNDTVTTGAGDDVYLHNVTTGGSDTVNLDGGTDVVILSGNAGQIRLTFTSAEIGDGSGNDSNTQLNQDGGLAVRLQAEDGGGALTGPVSRFDDEGMVFVAGAGQTFDVRDLVSGTQRGDQFKIAVLGTSAPDSLTAVSPTQSYYFNAGMGDDSISGGLANDFLVGGAGNDFMTGGGGNDTALGGSGNDAYIVEQAGDVVLEAAAGGSDTVYALTSYELGAGQEVEVLTVYDRDTTNAINLTGNNLVNTLYGNNGANVLNGGGGNDTLYGLGGNDAYIIEDSGDIVIEGAGGGFDTVYTLTSYQLVTDQSVETLTVYDRDTTNALNLTGNNLANTIYGNAGSNVIDGKGGDDVLYGMAGADTFNFTAGPGAGNVDNLADFSSVDDTIGLDHDAFLGVGPLGALNANAFFAGSGAHDADDRIIYNQATGQLFFDADGNGAGAQVLFATVNPGTIINVSDFTVI